MILLLWCECCFALDFPSLVDMHITLGSPQGGLVAFTRLLTAAWTELTEQSQQLLFSSGLRN